MRDPEGRPIQNVEALVASRHHLEVDDGLLRLFEALRALTTTELIPDFEDAGQQMLDRARADFESMQKDGESILAAVRRLQGKVRRFEQHEHSTVVLAHLFGVEADAPGEWPDTTKFSPLWNLFRPNDPWDLIEGRLTAFLKLSLKKGKPWITSHKTLKKAVQLCRLYLRRKKSWGKDLPSSVQQGDDLTVLEDPAERFVADALGAVGFPFALDDLSAAWRKR
jgi:hypothetical protein